MTFLKGKRSFAMENYNAIESGTIFTKRYIFQLYAN